MADEIYRVFEIVAIFFGVLLRTGAPYLRKKKINELLQMEMTWVYTAIAAFSATWIGIITIIPIGLDPFLRIIAGFSIAFSGNSILNEAMKWKQQYQYIKTGELPPQ